MAHRIAVLNEGRLEQLDVPETLYHRPATPFVADFVGRADFLTGLVIQGRVSTEIGDFANVERFSDGTRVVVMIRPDDVHIVPDNAGTARLVARQFKGSANLYTMHLPSGQALHSTEASTTIYPVGTAVSIRVTATHIVLFSAQEPYKAN